MPAFYQTSDFINKGLLGAPPGTLCFVGLRLPPAACQPRLPFPRPGATYALSACSAFWAGGEGLRHVRIHTARGSMAISGDAGLSYAGAFSAASCLPALFRHAHHHLARCAMACRSRGDAVALAQQNNRWRSRAGSRQTSLLALVAGCGREGGARRDWRAVGRQVTYTCMAQGQLSNLPILHACL